MAIKVLLVSPQFIKNFTNVSDNLSGKLLESAIWEAQNYGLRTVLGDCLVDRLEQLVNDNQVDAQGNEMYKELLSKIQYYLAYTAVSNVCMLTSVKIDNAGLERISDEHMEALDMDDSFRLSDYYQKKADFLCRQLQNYVLRNRAAFPELKECDCRSIRANLYSSATTGLWLGGLRGSRLRPVSGCRRRY